MHGRNLSSADNGNTACELIIALVLAIAAPPVPIGFAVCITILVTQLGIPEAAIPIVIAMSIFLDFFCTATNLFCLRAELTELAGNLDMLDTEILSNDSLIYIPFKYHEDLSAFI